METDSAALGMHAAEVVAAAWGRCLSLLASPTSWGPMPCTVAAVVDRADLTTLDGPVDSIVSVGHLGASDDLVAVLSELLPHTHAGTDLLFCEPTITAEEPARGAPHDVTGTLWATGWSVVDCRRYRVGRGPSAQHYVWGRARPVRRGTP